MQALAGEAAIALDRTRSAHALDQALARERLVGKISRRVRSVHDLDAVTRVAVTETGRAIGASRCFIRIGERDRAAADPRGVVGGGPVSDRRRAGRLPVSNLAARERRTVAVADVRDAAELLDESLGDVDTLIELGTRSVLATPIVVFDRMIGVLGLHRPEPGPWSAGDVSLAEAVAREIGLALHTARLLEENERRLGEQSALLKAAQVVTSELELKAVLQRLVDEVAQLLRAEAVDCFLLDAERGVLRCAAVHGLLERHRRLRVPGGQGALAAGRSRAAGRCSRTTTRSSPKPCRTRPTRVSASAIVAPMRWAGEVQGLLGVGTARPERRSSRAAQADLLEAFATLAALALRNAESFEERSRQARVQRGFYRIASVLGEPISLEETLDALAQAASRGARRVERGGVDADGRRSSPRRAARPARPAGQVPRGRPGRPLRGAALLRPRQARARRAAHLRRRPLRRRLAACDRATSGYRSLLAVPVETPRSEEGALVARLLRRGTRTSPTTTWSSRGTWPAPLEARSSGASSSRRSAARGRWRSSSPAPARCSRPSSNRAPCSTRSSRQAPALLGADAAVIRLLEGDELVASAASGEEIVERPRLPRPSTARLAGDAVQSRVAGRRSPTRATTSGCSRPTPCSPPATRATSASRSSARKGSSTASSRSTRRRRGSGRRRRWRRSPPSPATPRPRSRAPSSTRTSRSRRSAAWRSSSNIADGIVAVDREGKVVLWNAAAEQITGVPAQEALERTPERRAAARPRVRPRDAGRRAVRLDPARRRRDLALAHRGDHARPGRGRCRPHLRLPRHLRRARGRADEVGVRLQRLA